jgi:hypothetical protein
VQDCSCETERVRNVVPLRNRVTNLEAEEARQANELAEFKRRAIRAGFSVAAEPGSSEDQFAEPVPYWM